jgi:RNA polymerase sigma factor (sigma-70 family)
MVADSLLSLAPGSAPSRLAGEWCSGTELLGFGKPNSKRSQSTDCNQTGLTARANCVTVLSCDGRAQTPSPMDQDAARKQLAAALVRVSEGDRAALQLLYRDTSAKLFGVCLRILGDRSEAEDVLQDTYLTIWRRAAAFDPSRASPITWLVAIARNRSIDRLRASSTVFRMQPIDLGADVRDSTPDALEQVETTEQRQRLEDCLDELEQRHAAAIRAAFLDGATYEMLAQRMDVPLGTMKSWIRRSLIKLRACLEG